MQKQGSIKISSGLLIVALTLTLAGQAFATPNVSTNGKALTPGRDIASWTSDIALPGLSVSGINIVANGQPVGLRGINMGDPFWARISIFPAQWKSMDHTALLTGLAREVNAALNSGASVFKIAEFAWGGGLFYAMINSCG